MLFRARLIVGTVRMIIFCPSHRSSFHYLNRIEDMCRVHGDGNCFTRGWTFTVKCFPSPPPFNGFLLYVVGSLAVLDVLVGAFMRTSHNMVRTGATSAKLEATLCCRQGLAVLDEATSVLAGLIQQATEREAEVCSSVIASRFPFSLRTKVIDWWQENPQVELPMV